MQVNADFSRRAIVPAGSTPWVASPQPGVERLMLDRLGAESGHATSLVRYAPGSRFPAHRHPGGEEILVLSGTFSEGGVHHGAGCYLRNPPGSGHQPSSRDGATIFVKLCQMPPSEQHSVRVDTRDPAAWQHTHGRTVCPLFSAPGEQVRLERLAAGEPLWPKPPSGGAELLVLEGDLAIDRLPCPTGSWVRLPAGDSAHGVAGPGGALLYLKTGHLPNQ
ncbi:anti-sigma factor ChrR (cupin superfamily) [Acidovorax soli]|uniref:Anti-sigma factor ChrR (Cupin superfamily) n=1 Tax=Acidovorax soli TaxID=592050 RepID=A0A7X0PJT0_9BURK|nr:cupin domain-containing protein [Acidovorax soli]MBB6563268.1 anti-sigma factor ChrR (cupin superfamily) [Acidovorax soli]